ncbi:MAG: hypothetical protein LBS33_03720 [Streptococcaceae bacterium]|jgi:hypothetical protein|nr:hypothetical protein [Streptococcaceae bacterium]
MGLEETVITRRSRRGIQESQVATRSYPPAFIAWFLLIFSILLSVSFYAGPLLKHLPNGEVSIGRLLGMLMNKGGTPYLDFVTDKGPIYLLLTQLGSIKIFVFLIALIIQIFIYYFTLVILFKMVRRVVLEDKIAFVTTLIAGFLLSRVTFGGEVASLYVVPLISGSVYIVTSYLDEVGINDAAFILYGLFGALAAFIDSTQLVFWVVASVFLLVYNLVHHRFKMLIYQVLCVLFGSLLVIFPVFVQAVGAGNLNALLQNVFNNRLTNLLQTHLNNGVQDSLLVLLLYGVLIPIVPFILSIFSDTAKRWQNGYILVSLFAGLTLFFTVSGYQIALLAGIVPFLVIILAAWIKTLSTWRIFPLASNRKLSMIGVLLLLIISSVGLPLAGAADYGLNLKSAITSNQQTSEKKIAAWIKKESSAKDTIFVAVADSNIYQLASRKPASKYVLQSGVDLANYQSASKQLISELKANQPKYLVIPAKDFEKNAKLSVVQKEIIALATASYQPVQISGVNAKTYYIGQLKVKAAAAPNASNVSQTVPDESVTE